MYKVIKVDILKLRSFVLDEAYKTNSNAGLPKWDGIHSNRYLNRKVVKEYIINKLHDIIDDNAIRIELKEQAREAVLYVPYDDNEWIYLDKLMNKDIYGYVSDVVSV